MIFGGSSAAISDKEAHDDDGHNILVHLSTQLTFLSLRRVRDILIRALFRSQRRSLHLVIASVKTGPQR